jgi:cathepsin D
MTLTVAYFSPIGLGSNEKQFLVVMDTGSSDLWIPAANCPSQACRIHTRYGSADSSTLQVSQTPWTIQYGSGSASGVLIADSVTIANLTVSRMAFGAATQLSSTFTQFVSDNETSLTVET